MTDDALVPSEVVQPATAADKAKPRTLCLICVHPRVDDIQLDWAAGKTRKEIMARYGLTDDKMLTQHLTDFERNVRRNQKALRDSLDASLQEVHDENRAAFLNPGTPLKYKQAARDSQLKTIELGGRLYGALGTERGGDVTVNIHIENLKVGALKVPPPAPPLPADDDE